jgi:protein-S-isoprenylcysteine O-methyltransferase Ste14
MPKTLSIAAFAAMVAGIAALYYVHALVAVRPGFIALQVAAVLLMIAARITFGRRSFHAAANPTAGGVVQNGPYAYIRHPIYAAAIYFVWAGALDRFSWQAAVSAALVTAGAFIRMKMEERLLVGRYPEYAAYMARVRRIVPFIY